jgi:hypothetical protein
MHTAEPIVPELSDFEFMMAIEKLKRHKSPGTYQFSVELIKGGVVQFALRSINVLIRF